MTAKRTSGAMSAEGKRKSSQNARKHGCRSKERILPDERWPDYDALWEQWLDEYQPESRMTADAWLDVMDQEAVEGTDICCLQRHWRYAGGRACALPAVPCPDGDLAE